MRPLVLAVCGFYPELHKDRPRFKKGYTLSPDPQDPAYFVKRSDLTGNQSVMVDIRPNEEELSELAQELDILGARKVTLVGRIEPSGKHDWVVRANLGATVMQPCVVTLQPVTTRIEEQIERSYAPDVPSFEGEEEVELPSEDLPDPLGRGIDLGQLLREELALALPTYPRAEGASLNDATFTEPGATPMSDDDARPFAGLAALRDQLKSDNDT